MISGLGFSEMAVVAMVVLLFFGSKEVPRFIKETARLIAKARRYSDKVRRELDSVSRTFDEPLKTKATPSPRAKKMTIRRQMLEVRNGTEKETAVEQSGLILSRLTEMDEYKKAKVVMTYVSRGSEPDTRQLIQRCFEDGKRVVVPYCREGGRDLGIAEIQDPENHLQPGTHGVHEPIHDLRDNFLRSDIDLVVCPGVAFDRFGGRLGHGKGYFDVFLEEIKGKATIIAPAFSSQIVEEPLPFEYHDVSMDEVVTEKGLLLKSAEAEPEEAVDNEQATT